MIVYMLGRYNNMQLFWAKKKRCSEGEPLLVNYTTQINVSTKH